MNNPEEIDLGALAGCGTAGGCVAIAFAFAIALLVIVLGVAWLVVRAVFG